MNYFLPNTVFLVVFLFAPLPYYSQIITDGSLGPGQSIGGPDFEISETLGQRSGANLFHSFQDFNIHSGQSANFTGALDITNIIGRITGDNSSSINGKLQSSIPGANLFLLNPNGFIFGEEATLDIQGSFHVSTADFISFESGDNFNSQPRVNEILNVAPPAAFGFVGVNHGVISVKGSQLASPQGEDLSFIAGEISIDKQSKLSTQAGLLKIVGFQDLGKIGIGRNESQNNCRQQVWRPFPDE